jgi:DNA-binding transcriptional ArsR family regulator
MTLEELLVEIEQSPGDARLLRALGGALGIEMSKRRLGKLQPALRTVSRAKRSDHGYEDGYAAAVVDVVGAFQAVLAAEAEEADMAQLVRQSPYAEVLFALAEGHQTATAIAGRLGKNKSSASRALASLREAGLVVVHDAPDTDERLRPHRLTLRGERVIDVMRHPGRRGRKPTPVRGEKLPGIFNAAPRSSERARAGEPRAARKMKP